jgi:hypothetical protein
MENRSVQEFDLNGALDRLAARVCREIKSKHRRERAIKEFRGHLEDAAEDIMRQGNPPEKAYAELEESLGDTDKLSTLMASVHNTHHVPVILPWLAGAAVLGGLIYLYLTTENSNLQAWLGVGFQLFSMIAIVVLALFVGKWVRAIGKRASALRRLKKFAREHDGILTVRANPYKSLFVRTAYPELTVDMGDRRYILSFWATVKRRRTLHLQDSGIYSYDKHFGYMLAASPNNLGNYWARLPLFRPRGMEDGPLFTWYHSEFVKLPGGAHLMPEIDYDGYFAPDKINIPVFLLNPIPMDVEICESSHIHKLSDGDRLPASLGGAIVYSMSSFVSAVERAGDSGRTEQSLLEEDRDPIKTPKRRAQSVSCVVRHGGSLIPIRKKLRRMLLLRWGVMLLLGIAFGAFLVLSEPMFRNRPTEYQLNQAVTILLYLFIVWKSRILPRTFSKEWVGVIRECKIVPYTRNRKGWIQAIRPTFGVDALKCIWTVETEDGESKQASADTAEIREEYFKVGERIRLYKNAKYPVKAHPPLKGEDLMCPLCGRTSERAVCTVCGVDFENE